MRKHYDDRDYMVLRMTAYEEQVVKEIEAEQVRHIDLTAYQPGQPHYERLQSQLAEAQRFSWPSTFTVNL